jgi:hypothetical protein
MDGVNEISSDTEGYNYRQYLKEIAKFVTKYILHIAGNTGKFLSPNHIWVLGTLKNYVCTPSLAV